MRYVGGKSKLAKDLSKAILDNSTSRGFYLEPFVGGGAIFPEMVESFSWSVAGDLHTDLVLLWNALLFEGWVPPEFVSEAEYRILKDASPSPLRGFVGMGGSFGGKWFGGYARGGVNANGTPRNHQAESARSLIKARDKLRSVRPTQIGRFRNQTYSDWSPVPGTVVYCDPPYAGTQGYHTGDFDSSKFWDTCDRWVDNGCEVFVSEYVAPKEWIPVWGKTHRQSLAQPKQGRNTTVERLFTRSV